MSNAFDTSKTYNIVLVYTATSDTYKTEVCVLYSMSYGFNRIKWHTLQNNM